VFSGQLLKVSQEFSSIARSKCILRQDEERGNSNEDRDTAFDDEKPLPAILVSTVSIRGLKFRRFLPVKTSHTAHVVEDSGSKEARNDVTNNVSG